MDPSAPKLRSENAGKDIWHPGERCLAPSPDNETLCEASIKSIIVDENGKSFAIVLYSDFQEGKVPLKRLEEVKSVKNCSRNFIFDDEDLEKPCFPGRKFPSSAVAFPLSADGDSIPYTINRYLRDYQREGAQFLYAHFIQGKGCILGDDMGLGKTVQVISFLAAVLHKKGTREDIENNMPEFLLRSMKKEPPSSTAKKMFLIVAPLSVLYNWRDELDTWGYFRVTILHGNKKDNELVRVKQRKCEIALTTYETLRLCLDELNSLEWSAVIVDEAHKIKNPKARVTEVMKALKCNVRIGLTGTILQNNMKELWCVMDWAVPGLLGSRIHFKKQFSDPVEHGQRHTATKRELATGRKAMQRLAKMMSGWFLRRTKTLIKDQLPKKEDRVLQQLLNHCRKNKDKILLFSFSTKLLDVLQQYCMAAGFDYRRLDGSTKSEERIKIVKEFNSTQDVNICLVSTMAGGVGLNFVGANVVVLFDPTWNPANDLQAIDRAYRIGQCRDVKVFRLISLGTVEEIMYLRQVYKQQLHCVVVGSENAKRYFEAVQGSKEHRGELFGVYNLFKLRSQGSCLTRDILEREGKVEAGIMTATTWLKEEPPVHKQEMSREPDCQEHRGLEQPAELPTKETCDLCSDFSDDESLGNSRIKTAKNKASDSSKASGSPGQLTLLHCGFSKLFETKCKAFENSDGNIASDDESSDEQPMCLSVEAKDVGYQKSHDSLGTSQHQKLTNILNPNEKCTFDKSEKIFEQNISSESDDEKKFKNTADHHCILHSATEVEDNDVIFPTQYTTQRCPKNGIKFKPLVDGSQDSETENPIKIRNNGDDRKTDVKGKRSISKQLNPENVTLKSIMKRKGSSDISDESDDIEISSESGVRKRKATSSLRFKRKKENKKELRTFPKTMTKTYQLYAADGDCNSQAVDDFSSSDDDLTVHHISFSKQSHTPKTIKDRISFSSKLSNHKKNSMFVPRKSMKFSNERAVNQEGMNESMDKFLDGVQEVAYIHSNQTVIGSSKAENHMSRWAARDVFELKQFSQLPANVAVCTSKTHKEKMKTDTLTHTEKSQQLSEGNISFPLYISHPVSKKKKIVYRTEQTIFIIGETPKGIRRKQFQEMASYFNFPSVKEFASHITNATSEERQKMLKDFYASQYPEVKDFFVDSDAELIKSSHQKRESVRNKSEKNVSLIKERLSDSETLSFKDSSKKVSQIYSPKIHKEKSVKFQNHSFHREVVLSNDGETNESPLSSTQETDNGKNSQAPKNIIASCSLNTKSEADELENLEYTMKDEQNLTRTGISRNEPLFKVENKKIKNPVLGDTSVVGLLGDTSILDDLFKSHGNGPTQLPRKVLSGPMEKAKQRPKDFWDILNEQNDDSLSKLTDLAVIETLCEKVPLAASSKRKEELETSLWKSNEKFLWKKLSSSDTDENTMNAQK
uniref:ERCC excision repair 6 like 2 n=1 Tax=Canis lupus familiaris TaxID=9615 RepID=A0A8I3MN45_CANLF